MDREALRECQEAVEILMRHGALVDGAAGRAAVGLRWTKFIELVPVHLWRVARVDRFHRPEGPSMAVQVSADLGYALVTTWFMREAQGDPRVQQWLEAQGITKEQAGAAATAPAHD